MASIDLQSMIASHLIWRRKRAAASKSPQTTRKYVVENLQLVGHEMHDALKGALPGRSPSSVWRRRQEHFSSQHQQCAARGPIFNHRQPFVTACVIMVLLIIPAQCQMPPQHPQTQAFFPVQPMPQMQQQPIPNLINREDRLKPPPPLPLPPSHQPIDSALEPPRAALWRPSEGPGVDLVALNLRRFELNHAHPHRYTPNNPRVVMNDDFVEDDAADFARAQQIEAQVAAIPEKILSRLPEENTRQLIESLSADPTLMGLTRHAQHGTSAAPADGGSTGAPEEDPDGASIERLTKSCLTVQASSMSADQLNVTFHLYTRQNPNNAFVMGPQISRDQLLTRSPFVKGRPLKWITHGFHTNLDKSEWMVNAKDKILAHEDANVILTDWRRGASPALAFYPKAAANAHVVAKMIVKILRRLLADIDLSRVHLIGHSLGAHIMGFVGSAFTEEYLYNRQLQLVSSVAAASVSNDQFRADNGSYAPNASSFLIGRITACDPALPCFGPSSSGPNRGGRRVSRSLPPDDPLQQQQQQQPQPPPPPSLPPGRLPDDWTPALWTHLRPDSAVLVEVMHSNPGVMGYAEPLGDYDFFPNGSDRQPGCTGTSGGSVVARPGGAGGAHPPARARALVGPSLGRQFRDLPLTMSRVGGIGGGRLSKALINFLRPIRDFFQTYTCSHHRSVEYMVESLYYESIPVERRLDSQLVCQMVGYRCTDYQSFKRGFCFTCRNELECRSFGMTSGTLSAPKPDEYARQSTGFGYEPTLADRFAGLVRQAPDVVPIASSARHIRHWQRRSQTDHNPSSTSSSSSSSYRLASNQIMMPATSDEPIRPATANSNSSNNNNGAEHEANRRPKRIMPTFDQYKQNYKPTHRNQYYFDTKASNRKDYCLNHYHLLVKYRWFRIRESVRVERFRIFGSLNDFVSFNISDGIPLAAFKFNRFSQHAYTMLLTSVKFLGKIEALLIHGDQLKSQLIEYIDISYLSNLDARVRALSSARLCRADTITGQSANKYAQLSGWLGLQQPDIVANSLDGPINLFLRCPSPKGLV
jgi:pimeloyl-ACP methyl ester carboxylesterase